MAPRFLPRAQSEGRRSPRGRSWLAVPVVLFLTAAVLSIPRQSFADKPDAAGNDHAVVPRVAAEEFLKLLETGEVETAYESIYQTAAPLLAEKNDVRENLQTVTQKVLAAYGKPAGHTLVRTRTAGDDLVELFYLVKMPESPMGCRFTYYNGEDGFELIHIEVLYDIDELMGAAAEPGAAPDAAKAMADAFVKGLVGGKSREAYSALFAQGIGQLAAKKLEFTDTLEGNTRKGIALYGPPKSGTLAAVSKITDDVVRLQYCVRTPKLPLVWTFSLYRAGDTYKLVGVFFNEHYQDVLTTKK